jgi:hypothetical protein
VSGQLKLAQAVIQDMEQAEKTYMKQNEDVKLREEAENILKSKMIQSDLNRAL